MHVLRLTPWVAVSLLAGCQVVAGLTSLDTDAGAGGATASSTGGAGGTGAGGIGGEGGATTTTGGNGGTGGDGGDDCPNDCGPYLCENGACATTCMTTDDCADGGPGEAAICEAPMGMPGQCVYCGEDPGEDMRANCGGPACPTTTPDVTTRQCLTPADAVCSYACTSCTGVTGTVLVNAQVRPAEITCTGNECDGVHFECRGPFGCTLRCMGPGSCDGTFFECPAWAPCELVCDGPDACNGAGVTQECKENSCLTDCTHAAARVNRLGCTMPDKRCTCDPLPMNCLP